MKGGENTSSSNRDGQQFGRQSNVSIVVLHTLNLFVVGGNCKEMIRITVFILSLLLFVSAAPPPEPQQDYEEPVSYAGYQLWSANPRTDQEREFLQKILKDYGMDE